MSKILALAFARACFLDDASGYGRVRPPTFALSRRRGAGQSKEAGNPADSSVGRQYRGKLPRGERINPESS